MKGAGRLQQLPGIIGGWEFVPTDGRDPNPNIIPIPLRMLRTMQTIHRERFNGQELPPEIPDSRFYALYQAATERIGQEEAQESSSHGEPKYSGSSKSSLPAPSSNNWLSIPSTSFIEQERGLPATPLYSGDTDVLGEDISTPAKKNQKLIDMADKQTVRLYWK